MDFSTKEPAFGRFDLNQIARSFPDQAETMLLDKYLTDEASASTRLFRFYRATPAHYHAHSDEHLYVLSGSGLFWISDKKNEAAFEPGHFLVFRRGVVHALTEIVAGPVVFLAVDTPRRDPKDIVFVNPGDGTPDGFIAEST